MAREWVIRGVPRALALDMWWLGTMGGETPAPQDVGRRRGDAGLAGKGAMALVLLVALADVLFYRQAVGLSLAVFAGALFVAVCVLHPGGARGKPALLLLTAALPVVEHVQALSLGFLVAGLLGSVVWVTGGAGALAIRALRLLRQLPLRGLLDGADLVVAAAKAGAAQDHKGFLVTWAFPVGGGLLLAGLLVEANPVLDQALARLARLELIGFGRILFWIGAGLVVWPLIAPLRDQGDARAMRLPALAGPSAGSVARGLVLFNLILAVQTLMDAAYLWGGAALPPGMTAAEYAHRGAYPLLVTALLAGAFALAARPFAREDRRLRWLLLLWLGQNVALTGSAILRLELYVEAYGLTYLRIHAGIWMALVAVGLGLTGWQVWRDLPNRWLVLRSVALGGGTLYACAFVNFAAIIAAENLSRRNLVDDGYVCDLGPTAAAAIAASGVTPNRASEYDVYRRGCRVAGPQIEGWRDWGFRNWRVNRYLDAAAQEGAGEDTGRG